MSATLVVVGVALIALAVGDVLWTTLWSQGAAGPVTSTVTHVMAALLRRLPGPDRGRARSDLAGPVILAAVLATWVLLLAVGWAAMFLAAGDAIVESASGAPATPVDRLYFAGYNLFTLGNGDFRPRGAPWQLATVLCSASGLVLITLAITYLVPVISAATSKRVLAAQISALGHQPAEVARSLCRAWPSVVAVQLSTLAAQLGTLAEQHLAYPVLHDFHSRDARRSAPVAIAVLDEALTLISCGVRDDAQPDSLLVASARTSVGHYLDTLETGFVPAGADAPAAPDLASLDAAGIPVVAPDVFERRVARVERRRQLLCAAVGADGWDWDASVHAPERP